MNDDLSNGEIRKDALQDALDAAAGTVGQVAMIVTNAVRDITEAIGGLASEVFEIRDAAERAREDHPDQLDAAPEGSAAEETAPGEE